MASYQLLVTVELHRESGKFAGRDEIIENLVEQVEQAIEDVSGVGADGDSEYVVDDISVEEYTPPKKKR